MRVYNSIYSGIKDYYMQYIIGIDTDPDRHAPHVYRYRHAPTHTPYVFRYRHALHTHTYTPAPWWNALPSRYTGCAAVPVAIATRRHTQLYTHTYTLQISRCAAASKTNSSKQPSITCHHQSSLWEKGKVYKAKEMCCCGEYNMHATYCIVRQIHYIVLCNTMYCTAQ